MALMKPRKVCGFRSLFLKWWSPFCGSHTRSSMAACFVDDKLPGLDVLVCSADPDKEPSLDVMNTVISAVALDYPAKKISVFLSDDGGSPMTLDMLKAAWDSAKCWLPFCRKYRIKTGCPRAYFYAPEDYPSETAGKVFMEDMRKIKGKYDMFKNHVKVAKGRHQSGNSTDHPLFVEVIANSSNGVESNGHDMPLLVYVSREKKLSQAHHFKAGAFSTQR